MYIKAHTIFCKSLYKIGGAPSFLMIKKYIESKNTDIRLDFHQSI